MNNKLVESLADAIAALPLEEYRLFQEALMSRTVKKTPGVCGGHACIRDTRITVWTLISLEHQGADDEHLLVNFPVLSRFDLLAARAYYELNREEIDFIINDMNDELWNENINISQFNSSGSKKLILSESSVKRTLLTVLKEDYREQILTIAAKHGAYNVRIFGSVARNEENENSDIDFLIDYDSERRSAWFPMGLIEDLETLLGRKVDVGTPGMLKERIRERVLKEAVPL